MVRPKADFVIETSYEVVNPVGGVSTVISTKAKELVKTYGNSYLAIGPYHYKSARYLFKKEKNTSLDPLFKKLEKLGIVCYHGRWLIPGKPRVILIDYTKRLGDVEKIKKRCIKNYGIDLSVYNKPLKQFDLASHDLDVMDFNLQLVWGDSTRIVIENLLNFRDFKKKWGVIHFHFADPSLLMMKDLEKLKIKVGLVVTAHSTRLGRTICTNGEDLYGEIEEGLKNNKSVENKREYKYGGYRPIILHQIERFSTKYCDILTTVSAITGREAEYIFGRKTDMVTPNGIDTSKFPTIEERSVLHKKSKAKIWRFLEAYFLPYYNIDVREGRLMFISGRYEFRNKGYDVFIEALGNLNQQLKKKGGPTVFLFLFIYEQKKREPNYEVIANLAAYGGVRELVYDKVQGLKEELIYQLIHRNKLTIKDLFEGEFLQDSRRQVDAFIRREHKRPPLSILQMEESDAILRHLKKEGITNKIDDKVKVVYYPLPLSVGDEFLSMRYGEAIAGNQIGVFPSYYEPWGYTPQETAARGLISVTTDLAGFGDYLRREIDLGEESGVYVLQRRDRTHKKVVEELSKLLYHIVTLSREERIARKINAKKLSDKTSWNHFIKYYIEAHNLAIEGAKQRLKRK